MLNILSIAEKKKILVEYRFRLAVVSIFAVGALVLASLVLLAPSYLLAVAKYNGISAELARLEAKQGSTAQEKDINAQIININKKIDLFLKGGVNATSSPSQIILNILNDKGNSIKIQGFTYDAGVGLGRFVVVGTAIDRDSLAQFVERLKKEPTFTKVDLPISSYVKSANIDFSIVIERGVKK